MKKFIIALLMAVTLVYGASFSAEALFLKKNSEEAFNSIIAKARLDWTDNPEMIIYTVNNQSKALVEVLKIMSQTDYQETIMSRLIEEWGYNFEMVIYSYKKQVQAKKELEKLGR